MKHEGDFCFFAQGKGSFDARLYFRKTATGKVEEQGFHSARISPVHIPPGAPFYPLVLRVEWSPAGENPKAGWRRVSIAPDGRIMISFPLQILGVPPEVMAGILSLPRSFRTAVVSRPSPQEMILRFGLPNSFFFEPPQSGRQKSKFLGPCSLRFEHGSCLALVFLAQVAKEIEDIQGLALFQRAERGWFFHPEKGCLILCNACWRLDCYPLHFGQKERAERRIYMTDLAPLLAAVPLVGKPTRGEVWRTEGNFILVKFPKG